MTKPQYEIPSMAEIAALPWNGLTVASLFSGCGGSSLGYRMGGCRVAWANEFIPAAADTYRANASPSTILNTTDIRDLKPEDILTATGLRAGDLDILDGSPPCSSFSMAGARERLWGKAKAYSDGAVQRTDDLFPEYVRLLKGIQPRAFVAENVGGLVRGVAKGFFLEFLAAFKAAGYRVRCQVLDASWLGVPQGRRRAIFVGIRQDLAREPVFPRPLPYQYTLADALAVAKGQLVEPESSMAKYAVGREWAKLKPGGQSPKYFQLVRPRPDRPCPTITATSGQPGAASVTHPHECRKLSVAEAKAVCGFPADFALTGDYTQRIERLGRAVPPVMMKAVAEAVCNTLKGGEHGNAITAVQ